MNYKIFIDFCFVRYQNYLQASIARRKKLNAKLKERLQQKEDSQDLTEIYEKSHLNDAVENDNDDNGILSKRNNNELSHMMFLLIHWLHFVG
jgi:hypothetical protein